MGVYHDARVPGRDFLAPLGIELDCKKVSTSAEEFKRNSSI